MPRPFTNGERSLLRQKLRHAARVRIEQVGIRATAVADLTREVGISKGAFYLLFESKEELVAEVFTEVEAEVRAELDALVDRPARPEDRLGAVIGFLFEVVAGHPLLRLLSDPDEGPLLWRTVPEAEMAERMADDDRYFRSVARRLKAGGSLATDVSPDLVASLPRLALAVAQGRGLIGEDRYQETVELVVAGLVTSLSETTG